ncbi:MAG TPA: SDR family NAD(P)-dependent oxidoreductase, partial [Alphaproteobacteria bacterium]|nr:SDR family NAD(P)-dependent oxidoreductase [Alphaproteobacteria bacterium]
MGRDLALHYARAGWHVALHHYRSVEEAIELQSHARSIGAKMSLFQADLKEKGAAETLLSRVIKECGLPRLLINNASGFEKDEPLMREENFAMHMMVNLFAPMRLTQGLHARAESPCTSITLGDATLPVCWKNFPSYAISKSALMDWVKASAPGFRPKLNLYGLLLGPTLRHPRESERHFDELVSTSRSHKQTSVEEIAATIDRLVENSGHDALIDLS